MVDYSPDLRNLKLMEQELRRVYANRATISDDELAAVRRVRTEMARVWGLAVQTHCIVSENELVDIGDNFEKLFLERGYRP